MDEFVTTSLNATGSSCWREISLDLTASIQNDLLIVVDQADAVVLLREASLPTLAFHYNDTKQEAIPRDEDGGGDATWQQARIAYASLSHGARWYIGVYLDADPWSSVPQPPRTFRVRLAWAQNVSFKHLSKTIIILLSVGGVVVLALALLALRMRFDAWRAKRRANGGNKKAAAALAKARANERLLRESYPEYMQMR